MDSHPAAQVLRELRVLSCRQIGRGDALAEAVQALGGTVIQLPLVEVQPADADGLRSEAERIDRYDWLVCTSANGVDTLAELTLPATVRVAAVGAATAAAFVDVLQRQADLVPTRSTARDLADEFPEGNGRVLAVLAELADDDLQTGLSAKGWDVCTIRSYRTVLPENSPEAIERAGTADVVVITAPSIARRLREVLGDAAPSVAVVTGPKSASEAQRLGFETIQVEPDQVVEGLRRFAS